MTARPVTPICAVADVFTLAVLPLSTSGATWGKTTNGNSLLPGVAARNHPVTPYRWPDAICYRRAFA